MTDSAPAPAINPKTAISRRLRWRSWMYSGGSLFIFGLLIFAFGYGFERFRKAETDVIAATEKERQSLVNTSADISAQISSISKLLAYDAERKKLDPASTDETIKSKLVEVNEKYKTLETSLDLGKCLGDCLDQKLVGLKSQKDDVRKIIESTTPYVVNLAGKRSENDAKGSFIDSSTAYLIAGASSKFGILTLLLFLLVILGRLYQYMSRLSSFYASRADALDLLGEIEAKDNHELLHSLTRIMSPAFAMMGKDTEGVFEKILSGASDKADAILKPQDKEKK